MTDSLQHLTQAELFQLGLGAMQRDEDAGAIVFLKEAADRQDASAQALFLLGSLYAQIGLIDPAVETMARAVDADASFAIARFQLGMLHLTSGRAETALQTWAPLARLDGHSPFPFWQQGLECLVRDDFDAALPLLRQGIILNADNPPLNGDIQLLIDRVEQHQSSSGANVPAAEAAQGEGVSHLFLSIYSKGRTS